MGWLFCETFFLWSKIYLILKKCFRHFFWSQLPNEEEKIQNGRHVDDNLFLNLQMFFSNMVMWPIKTERLPRRIHFYIVNKYLVDIYHLKTTESKITTLKNTEKLKKTLDRVYYQLKIWDFREHSFQMSGVYPNKMTNSKLQI